MRILICGDRNWTDEQIIEDYIKSLPRDTVIIEGEAQGADIIAKNMALKHNLRVTSFPADWNLFGLAAGPIRNKQMLDDGKPDLVVAFHNDLSKSKGTKNMIDQALRRGIPVETRKRITKEEFENAK